jgi:hypothetical protein
MVHKVASIFPITSKVNSSKVVLDLLGVTGDKVYKACPTKCSICKGTEFSTLELVGVHQEPLFWECEDCSALHCMEERPWIEKQVSMFTSSDTWTNPNDWDRPDDHPLN